MNNIRQLTNFDLINAEEESKAIIKGGVEITHTYKHITSSIFGSDSVFKFGYCANNNEGMNYPIFIKLKGEGDFRTIYLGKTGMYEFQTENWKDVNSSDEEEQEGLEAIVYLSEALVPTEVNFCIDYCYSV